MGGLKYSLKITDEQVQTRAFRHETKIEKNIEREKSE